jgi:hypothetical protein
MVEYSVDHSFRCPPPQHFNASDKNQDALHKIKPTITAPSDYHCKLFQISLFIMADLGWKYHKYVKKTYHICPETLGYHGGTPNRDESTAILLKWA